jgi:hypothetical protein
LTMCTRENDIIMNQCSSTTPTNSADTRPGKCGRIGRPRIIIILITISGVGICCRPYFASADNQGSRSWKRRRRRRRHDDCFALPTVVVSCCCWLLLLRRRSSQRRCICIFCQLSTDQSPFIFACSISVHRKSWS